MNVRLLSFFLLCCLAMIASAQAGIVTYTLAGGTIDGSLNGTSFSGANFTITANADPKDFVDGTLTGSPLLSQPAVSTMTIDGFSPFQITSVNFAPWLFYLDEDFAYGGFGYQVSPDAVFGIAVLGAASTVSGISTVSGDLLALTPTLTTTAGDLVLENGQVGVGTFSGAFSPGTVPEPSSMAIFGLGALGMAYRARRKVRK